MLAQAFYDTYQPEITSIFRHAYQADPETQSEIREQLLDRMTQFYENNRQKGLKQFHFHLPNGDSLLRFHRPSRHGDNLMPVRHSVKIANTRHLYVQGFETGKVIERADNALYQSKSNGRNRVSVTIAAEHSTRS